jgi:hypothetical protein
MPNEKGSNDPPAETKRESSSATPTIQGTSQQDEVRGYPDSRPQSEEKETIRLEKDIRSGERWLIRINGASVIISIVIAAVYFGQLRQMKKATEKAGISADAARSAANTAAQAFKVDQRPYLIAVGPPVFLRSPVPEKNIQANITFKNIGKTPATRTINNCNLLTYRVPSTSPQEQNRAFKSFLNSAFAALEQTDASTRKELYGPAEVDVAPGTTSFFTSRGRVILSPVDFSLMGKEPNPQFALYFVCVASYTDAFGGNYETDFCEFYFGIDPKTWHICDAYNIIK